MLCAPCSAGSAARLPKWEEGWVVGSEEGWEEGWEDGWGVGCRAWMGGIPGSYVAMDAVHGCRTCPVHVQYMSSTYLYTV